MSTTCPLLPLPIGLLHTAFTASTPLHHAHPSISLIPLSDKAFGAHKISQLPHPIVHPPSSPADTRAWEAFYPEGSINPSAPIKGGLGLYLSGPDAFARTLPDADEALLAYDVLFEDAFAWAKGGKLPGIFGGTGDLAYRCSGGRQDDRCQCFNLRMMWRANGQGELYAYLPLTAQNAERLLAVPNSHQNADYGISVGTGAWTFTAGQWTTIATRVKLNVPGVADGEVEVYIDGRSVICATGLTLRSDASAHIKGMHFQTFFGGHTNDWASPRDQRAWFANVSGAVVRRPPPKDEL